MRRPAVRGAAVHSSGPTWCGRCASSATRCRPAVGPVEAVSGYRNPALNACARGSRAQRPSRLLRARPDPAAAARPAAQLFERLCAVHAATGRPAGAGLGFYTFPRFHIDTRSFRRWGCGRAAGQRKPLRGARARRRSGGPAAAAAARHNALAAADDTDPAARSPSPSPSPSRRLRSAESLCSACPRRRGGKSRPRARNWSDFSTP